MLRTSWGRIGDTVSASERVIKKVSDFVAGQGSAQDEWPHLSVSDTMLELVRRGLLVFANERLRPSLLRDLPLTARPPWGLSTPLGRKDTKQLEASVVDPGLTLQFAHNVVRTLRDALVDLGDPARKGR